MNQTQIRIGWDAYLNNVSKEFTCLQQNAEFVDMTLAAEGHLVKVHRNIVAIASPYIKAMLQSTPCQHPVIFLNNVSHKTLGYVLEYIYTGEVNIPPDIIELFIDACRSLYIRGVDGIAVPKITPDKHSEPQVKGVDKSPDNNFAAHITINNIDNNYNLEVRPNENNVIPHNNQEPSTLPVPVVINDSDLMDFEDLSSHVNDYKTVCEDNNIDIDNINNFIILNPKSSNNNTELSINNTENAIIKLNDQTIVDSHIPAVLDSSLIKINPRENLVKFMLNTDWHNQEPSYTEPSDNAIPHSVNVTLNTTDWHDQEPSHTESSHNAIPLSVNATLNTTDWHNQEPSHTESSHNAIPHSVNVTLNTTDWHNQEPSHTESRHNVIPHLVNVTLNTNDGLPQQNQSNSETHGDSIESNENTEYRRLIPTTVNRRLIMKKIKKIGCRAQIANQMENKAKITLNKLDRIEMDKKAHYTISTRGSLQLLLKRFLYHSHHHSNGGNKRRWRCIDYRKMHCPAYIDTYNEEITVVMESHSHPDHDGQIRKKIKNNTVFSSYTTAVNTIDKVLKDEEKSKIPENKKHRRKFTA